ncbi:MAG: type II toxin-antitoxin system CcdA family antitoxin [Actinomycetota bacterium]|nr:type II toxin-antitoxin system CcdA family antitoxin [Actinomycetota bacterium]
MAEARRLGVNISAAAREGVAAAVRSARADADRVAYREHTENADDFWTTAESWREE